MISLCLFFLFYVFFLFFVIIFCLYVLFRDLASDCKGGDYYYSCSCSCCCCNSWLIRCSYLAYASPSPNDIHAGMCSLS